MQVENGETGVVITEFTITNGVGGWFDGWTYGGGVYVMDWGCGQKPGLISQEVVHAFLRGTNEGSPAVHQV